MVQFSCVIKEELGIHARPAGLIAKKAKTMDCAVTISCGENSCDARKLMKLMSLEAQKDDTLVVTVEGPDEGAAAKELEQFLGEII